MSYTYVTCVSITCKSSRSPAKVAQLEDGSFGVNKEVLGLDVSVTNTLGMDISQAAKQLVHVHLRKTHRTWNQSPPDKWREDAPW